MTEQEAIKILHPDTTSTAIAEIEYYAGFKGREATIKAVEDACVVACEALEKQIPYKPQVYEDKYYGCKCGNNLLLKWDKYPTKLMPKSEGLPRCLACGQKLDWGD